MFKKIFSKLMQKQKTTTEASTKPEDEKNDL
jgi:hypothetical protein